MDFRRPTSKRAQPPPHPGSSQTTFHKAPPPLPEPAWHTATPPTFVQQTPAPAQRVAPEPAVPPAPAAPASFQEPVSPDTTNVTAPETQETQTNERLEMRHRTAEVVAESSPQSTPAPHLEAGKRLYPVTANPCPAAIVIHCSDPRFQAAFEQFLEHELGLAKGAYIPIVVGGGAGVLGHPEQLPKEFKFLKERLEHYRQIFPTAHRIILINHEGCRYYQNLKSRALAMIGARLHMPLDLGREDLSLVAQAFRHFLAHLGYTVEYYYAKFADPGHTHIEIEKITL